MPKNTAQQTVDLGMEVEAAYQNPVAKKISKAIVGAVIASPAKDDTHNTPTRKKIRGWTRYLAGGATAAAVILGVPAVGAALSATGVTVLSMAGVAAGVVAARAASRLVGRTHDFVVDHLPAVEAEAVVQLGKVVNQENAQKVVAEAKAQGVTLAKKADAEISKMSKDDIAKLLDTGANKVMRFMLKAESSRIADLPNVDTQASAKIRTSMTASAA